MLVQSLLSLVLGTALFSIPFELEKDGLYVKGLQITVGTSLPKVRKALGPEDKVFTEEKGTSRIWEITDDATLVCVFDDAGGIQTAWAAIPAYHSSAKVDIYSLHTYTGNKRKIALGQTTMGEVRKWFANAHEYDPATKKERPIQIKATEGFWSEGAFVYGWTYEFDPEATQELGFFTLWGDPDRPRTQAEKDKVKVKLLWVGERDSFPINSPELQHLAQVVLVP